MGRPNVSIEIVKDRLGRQTAAQDGTSLLYVGLPNTYPLYSALALGMVFYSLRNAEDAGITQALDISNEILLWEHIKDFYTNAPEGTALHVLAFAKSTSYQALFTAPTTNSLDRFLFYFLSTFPFTFNFITSIFSSPSLSTTFTAILCSPALNKYVCLPVLSNKISGLKLVSL